MKRLAYRDTSVPVERSQKAIRDLLQSYGAAGVQFTEQFEGGEIMVRFAYRPDGDNLGENSNKAGRAYFIRLKASVPEASRQAKREAMQRAAWRAVFYALKSRMESVQYGIESFEEAFLAHFELGVDAKGKEFTVGDQLVPRLRAGRLALPAGKEES